MITIISIISVNIQTNATRAILSVYLQCTAVYL